MADPVTIGAGLVLLGIGLPGRGMTGGGPVAPADAARLRAGARFPLGAWQDYPPAVSSAYGAANPSRPDHNGVDVMYRRRGAGAPDLAFPAGSTNGSRGFFCPPQATVHAVADGYLWHTGIGGTGLFVVIDHGAPWASFYVHLESLAVPKAIQRGAGRVEVKAGQLLGLAGWSPRDPGRLRHLHFELWYKGGSSSHVDPWPLLQGLPLP